MLAEEEHKSITNEQASTKVNIVCKLLTDWISMYQEGKDEEEEKCSQAHSYTGQMVKVLCPAKEVAEAQVPSSGAVRGKCCLEISVGSQ